MEIAAKNRLKQFIEDYIPVDDLMKVGFFEKGTGKKLVTSKLKAMNKNFFTELTKLEDCEFFRLEHHFSIARMIRDTMSKNAINEKTMAGIIGVQPKRMKEVVNGAYPFDLRILSKLQSYQQELASNNAKLKIEAESIGSATYKYQYPMYVERIEKLLKILEENTIG